MTRTTLCLALGGLVFLGGVARADVGPLSPEAALRTLRVDKGLRVDLVAAEPLVMDPVAMAIDENGVMFVAEMADYPLGPEAGRIKRLVDNDGDGRMDRAVLFADKLPYPNGLMPWRGGILVTAAPDIIFLKDTDGDGKSDLRQVVFTGFALANQQHRLNGLVLGIDNWIYGASGGSGGLVRSVKDPAAPLVTLRGTDFRFGTDLAGFEIVSGHSQYANAFDDWGHRFINDNSHHIRQPVLEQTHLARSPHLRVESVEQDLPDHGNAAEVFPISELAERPNDQDTAGHFTSACSVTIYRGNLLPPVYQGSAFVAEPVHNLVHRDVLVPQGATFVAHRADEKREFLASTDNWFRPVNFAVGPNGALFVVDMYRAIIEHPQWIPLEMQKRVDLRAGQDRGRIYRVVPQGYSDPRGPAAAPELGKMKTGALVALYRSANAWQRTTAQRLVIERHDLDAVPALLAMTKDRAPLARLHALWTLNGLQSLDDKVTVRALSDPDPGVREAALRMAEPRLRRSRILTESVIGMSADPSPQVRFQVALALGAVGPDKRALGSLAKVAVRDGGDRWTRLAILTSISDRAPEFLARVQAVDPAYLGGTDNGAREILQKLAEVVGSSRNEDLVLRWLRAISTRAPARPENWRLLALAALGPSLRQWGVGIDGLVRRAGVGAVIAAWTPILLAATSDTSALTALRVNAIDFLSLQPPPDMPVVLEKLLRPQEPSEIQVAAVRALAATPGYTLGALVVGGWKQYTAAVRREALVAMLRQESEAGRVIEALEKGHIRVVEIDQPQREALGRYAKLQARAQKLFEPREASQTEATVATLAKKILALKGAALPGEDVYRSSCAVCHRLHGQGYAVGPNLESVVGRDKEALLSDILNPNRAVDPKFQVYVVKTATQEMSGIITAESPGGITLRAAMAVDTVIARRDIVDMKAHPASMMPEGLEANLTPQNLADLLVFLSAPKTKP